MREDAAVDLDWLFNSEPLRSSMCETEAGSAVKTGVGEGKCLEMFRMPMSSSSERSEVSLRSLGVGIRRDEARLGLLLFQLERALVDDREEVAVRAEVRLDLRDDQESPFLAEGLQGLRGDVDGLGGSGKLGGGPMDLEGPAEPRVSSLLVGMWERRREAMLPRALEVRREGGPDELSVAVVVCKL